MTNFINPNPKNGNLTFTAIYNDGTQYNSSENGDYFETVESIYDYMVSVFNNESNIERIVALDCEGKVLADTNEG